MTRLQHNCGLGVVALALLLLLTAPVLADELQGTIAMIEPDDYTFILVDNNNNVLNFRFELGGDVVINDEHLTMWDVNPGDRVTVTFRRDGKELVATGIHDFGK